ncbi:MAG: hypothetical protein E8D40_15595 [Nitrospira sp.]|nr:MAG: hypothetical protein E8D40_15595 [Nitrospira sp.]
MTTRIPSIESFRVLAIFAVVLWHAGFVASLSELVDGYFPVVLTGYLVWWVGPPYFFYRGRVFFRTITIDLWKSHCSISSVCFSSDLDIHWVDVYLHYLPAQLAWRGLPSRLVAVVLLNSPEEHPPTWNPEY